MRMRHWSNVNNNRTLSRAILFNVLDKCKTPLLPGSVRPSINHKEYVSKSSLVGLSVVRLPDLFVDTTWWGKDTEGPRLIVIPCTE